MCLAAAYKDIQSEEPILQEVARVIIEGDRLELENLFGEKKVVKGKIHEIDFMNSRLYIK